MFYFIVLNISQPPTKKKRFFKVRQKSANINFMKIIYFGSTEDSIYTLDVLKQSNFEIFAIFTKKSKSMRRDRGTSLTSIENYARISKSN